MRSFLYLENCFYERDTGKITSLASDTLAKSWEEKFRHTNGYRSRNNQP